MDLSAKNVKNSVIMTEDVPYFYHTYPPFYWQYYSRPVSGYDPHCRILSPDSQKQNSSKRPECYSVEFLQMVGINSGHNPHHYSYAPPSDGGNKTGKNNMCRTRYWSAKKSLSANNSSSESPSPNSYDSDDSGMSSNASSSAQSSLNDLYLSSPPPRTITSLETAVAPLPKGECNIAENRVLQTSPGGTGSGVMSCVIRPSFPAPDFMQKRRCLPRANQHQQQRMRHTNFYCHQQIAPDKYLMYSNLFVVKSPSAHLLDGSKWDSLSQDIWDQFMFAQQTEDTFKTKMMVWKYLYTTIRIIYPRYGLYLVGSTVSGFGSDTSDMDLCLLVSSEAPDNRSYALSHLEAILTFLRHMGPNVISHAELIRAKVPILKLHSHSGIEVDLNCNNEVGIRNTRLLFYYSQMDWRVRPLVLMVKLWARYNNINDAKNRTVSSYSLALMVIHYLQCGCSPAVLPRLEAEAGGDAAGGVGGAGAGGAGGRAPKPRALDPRERPPAASAPPCPLSLGELFHGFLCYYANFQYDKFAISVRTGSKVPVEVCRNARSSKNDPHQWKLLCIEEPFDLTNTARSVYDPEVFERIRELFKQSHQRLSDTMSLASIVPLRR